MSDKQELARQKFLDLLSTAELVTGTSARSDKSSRRTASGKTKVSGFDAFWPVVKNDELFKNGDGSGYIVRDGKLFMLDIKNRELVEDLRLAGREQTGKVPSRETIATAMDLLSAMARRDGQYIDLANRCGKMAEAIYYDLADGRAVELKPDKWQIAQSPWLFKHFNHQKPQVHPSIHGDVNKLWKFFHLNEQDRLLLLVTLVTCFVPDIAHPAIHVSGCQGAGKSIFSSLWKTIVDPSSVILSLMPRKPEDLDLLLAGHYVLVLDNLSTLSADTCDRLCAFITGGVIEKRTLHTDLETTVLKANSIIFFTGIGSLHSRADLIERSIRFELDRVPPEKRLDEIELFASFKQALPDILAGIFDLICQAIKIHPMVNLPKLPRMASFARWGYAIAEALGGQGDEFLRLYKLNTSTQVSSLLEENTLFSAIVQTFVQSEQDMLTGSFGEVVDKLTQTLVPDRNLGELQRLKMDRTFPSARGLRNQLLRIRIPLEDAGISFRFIDQRASHGKAFVELYRLN